ncbi:hypothetical protein [Mycobacterium sp.]|uniref:hypothetical protein n=1 Tax=Mycobacterium sp. TaxID=1785 RepID=UPI002CCEEAC0|nr:hypothetical protein [Mycobacterium sp.]HTY35387.1 hypothetical protein [Mycobacterium sp.]
MDVVKVATDKVQITLNVEEAATLAATIHAIGAPISPWARTQAVRILTPLADAIFKEFT